MYKLSISRIYTKIEDRVWNYMYLFLDRRCTKSGDLVWNNLSLGQRCIKSKEVTYLLCMHHKVKAVDRVPCLLLPTCTLACRSISQFWGTNDPHDYRHISASQRWTCVVAAVKYSLSVMWLKEPSCNSILLQFPMCPWTHPLLGQQLGRIKLSKLMKLQF